MHGHANPVLIFGAGYDTNEDVEPPSTDIMGRGIFVLDAITGAVVWKSAYGATSACSGDSTQASCTVSDMTYSIPADITLVDRDSDGYIDRLYTGDMGGNIWRVDLQPGGNDTPDYWQVNKLAALGCYSGTCSAGSTPRKFFYPPEIIFSSLAYSYDAIIAGSGDREHPLDSSAASSKTNRIYLLKDTYTGDDASGMTAITQNNLFDATSTAWDGTGDGYKITLGSGEKVVNAPLVTGGYAYMGTNQPDTSADSCTANLGIARGYQLSPFEGTYYSQEFDGGGLPPSPVSGVVSVETESGTKLYPFLIGGVSSTCVGSDCASAIGAQKPTISIPTNRTRTYWYIDNK